MKLAVLFGSLTLLFLVLFICYLDLLIFFFRERKRFFKEEKSRDYLENLEKRHRKTKHFQKKNFLLYLICLASVSQGYPKKAENLLPFVRTDILLGIYPKKK